MPMYMHSKIYANFPHTPQPRIIFWVRARNASSASMNRSCCLLITGFCVIMASWYATSVPPKIELLNCRYKWQWGRKFMIRSMKLLCGQASGGTPGMLGKASHHYEMRPRILRVISRIRHLGYLCMETKMRRIDKRTSKNSLTPDILMPICCKASLNSLWLMHPSLFLSRNRKMFSNLVLESGHWHYTSWTQAFENNAHKPFFAHLFSNNFLGCLSCKHHSGTCFPPTHLKWPWQGCSRK